MEPCDLASGGCAMRHEKTRRARGPWNLYKTNHSNLLTASDAPEQRAKTVRPELGQTRPKLFIGSESSCRAALQPRIRPPQLPGLSTPGWFQHIKVVCSLIHQEPVRLNPTRESPCSQTRLHSTEKLMIRTRPKTPTAW